MASNSRSASATLMQGFLLSTIVLAIVAQSSSAHANKELQQQQPQFRGLSAIFPRQSRSPFDMMMLAEKREKPLSGYGWEQCEFSPMSCLLRRRRRSVPTTTTTA